MTKEPSPASENRRQPGLLGKIFAFIIGLAVLLLAFMFSLVIVAVLAAGGLIVWGWLWWKTRALRQQMREQVAPASEGNVQRDNGRIIEGEIIRDSSPAKPPEEPPR
jgi:hypothetical protein